MDLMKMIGGLKNIIEEVFMSKVNEMFADNTM